MSKFVHGGHDRAVHVGVLAEVGIENAQLPTLLDVCHAEQIPIIVLPGPDGSSWTPS